MSDLLSAASLLFTVVGILYGAWYSEIAAALSLKRPTHGKDAVAPREQIRIALKHRSEPLAAGAVVIAAVLLPEAVKIAVQSTDVVLDHKFRAISQYDGVSAGVIAITTFSIALAISLVRSTIELRKKHKEFSF